MELIIKSVSMRTNSHILADQILMCKCYLHNSGLTVRSATLPVCYADECVEVLDNQSIG